MVYSRLDVTLTYILSVGGVFDFTSIAALNKLQCSKFLIKLSYVMLTTKENIQCL